MEQGKVEDKGTDQRRSRPAVKRDQQGGKPAQKGSPEECRITGVKPEQGGQLQVAPGADISGNVGQTHFNRNNSLTACQTLDLNAQRGEGDQVGNAQQT